jgi:hypothetical protein
MIIGSQVDGVNVTNLVAADFNGTRLLPRVLNDGRYALPDNAQTDPETSAAHSILANWTNSSTPDYVADLPYGDFGPLKTLAIKRGNNFWVHLGGRGNNTMTMPHANVFRFSAGQDDAYASDLARGVRRSMIGATSPSGQNRGPMNGETSWCSFCLVLGDLNAVDTLPDYGGYGTLFMQWQTGENPGGIITSPPVSMNLQGQNIRINTASTANMSGGVPVFTDVYSGPRPAKGVKTYFVMETKWGASGYIKVWQNGSIILDLVTPLGFYTGVSGTAEIGWACLGPYGSQSTRSDVIYIANPEWSLSSLSSRIASPLSVPDLNW